MEKNVNNYSKEIFRKILHTIAYIGICLWPYAMDDCIKSVGTTVIGIIVLVPILYLLSRVPGFSSFFYARKQGEYASSFASIAIAYCIVATVCWGILEEKYLCIVSFLAWGPGDAVAALVGQRYGKHKIGKDKKKSLEGSLVMFATSFISVLISMLILSDYGVLPIIIIALIVGSITAQIELKSHKGMDTIFCPVGAMGALVVFTLLFRLV